MSSQKLQEGFSKRGHTYQRCCDHQLSRRPAILFPTLNRNNEKLMAAPPSRNRTNYVGDHDVPSIILYPMTHRGHAHYLSQCYAPPTFRSPKEPRHQRDAQFLLSPPPIHRITSDPLPFLRFERIGDPSLRVFKLRLPRDLVGRFDAIISESDKFVSKLPDGWMTELYSLTKQDFALQKIPGMIPLIHPIVDFIQKAIITIYNCNEVTMDKNQPHILKYSVKSGHTGVQLHHDRCDVTANVTLSSKDEYEGGGTYIPDVGVLRLDKGEFLLHPGTLVHGGMEISRGTRILMVLFADLK